MRKIEDLEEWEIELIEKFMSLRREYGQLEHLIDSTIRQTKTSDTLFQILEKFSLVVELSTDIICDYLIKKGVIKTKKDNYFLKINTLSNLYEEFKDLFDFYITIKKLQIITKRGEYTIINEFSRNIELQANLNGQEVKINIPLLKEKFNILKRFFDEIVKKVLKNIKEGDL